MDGGRECALEMARVVSAFLGNISNSTSCFVGDQQRNHSIFSFGIDSDLERGERGHGDGFRQHGYVTTLLDVRVGSGTLRQFLASCYDLVMKILEMSADAAVCCHEVVIKFLETLGDNVEGLLEACEKILMNISNKDLRSIFEGLLRSLKKYPIPRNVAVVGGAIAGLTIFLYLYRDYIRPPILPRPQGLRQGPAGPVPPDPPAHMLGNMAALGLPPWLALNRQGHVQISGGRGRQRMDPQHQLENQRATVAVNGHQQQEVDIPDETRLHAPMQRMARRRQNEQALFRLERAAAADAWETDVISELTLSLANGDRPRLFEATHLLLPALQEGIESVSFEIKPTSHTGPGIEPFTDRDISTFLKVVSRLPQLQRVSLANTTGTALLMPMEALTRMLTQCCHLDSLRLSHFTTRPDRALTDGHGNQFQRFLTAIRTRVSKLVLEDFRVHSSFGQVNSWFAFGLTHVTELEVSSPWGPYDTDRLVHMLQNSPALEKLTLRLWRSHQSSIHQRPNDNGWYILPLAQALVESPPPLKELTIVSEALELDNVRGLVALVRKNCHLEDLQFHFAPQDVQLLKCWQEIQFYLHLNRSGRQRWIANNMSPSEWIEILANCSGDMSSLFYILHLGVALFSLQEE